MSSQTTSVAAGVLTACLYAVATGGAGAVAVRALLGRGELSEAPGRSAFVVLAFVAGQGLLGTALTVLGLAHALTPAAVWGLVIVGLSAAAAVAKAGWAAVDGTEGTDGTGSVGAPLPDRLRWLATGLLAMLALRAVASVLPTRNDDALLLYLFSPRLIAAAHGIAFQPAVLHNGLLPQQVEIHWAALFAISNDTAVTVWDFLCAVGAVGTVYTLARVVTADRGVAVVAVLILATSPAFTLLMGAGKPDDAAVQFGVCAFACVWLARARPGARVLAGLCLGWAIASRYTQALLVGPWLALLVLRARGTAVDGRPRRWGVFLLPVLAAAAAVAPMLLKGWLLAGHPLAPLLGDARSFWLWRDAAEAQRNLAWRDLPFYPFVMTFAERPAMLGTVSPLYLGLFPMWLLARRHPLAQTARMLLPLAAAAIGPWIVLQPLALEPRFHLPALALAAVPLAAGLVAFTADGRHARAAGIPLGLLLAFWIGVSAWSAREGISYAAGVETRAARLAAKSGYDVAEWLDTHVAGSERVALRNMTAFRSFVRPDIVARAETRDELQQVWEAYGSLGPRPWDAREWRMALGAGYAYVVMRTQDVAPSMSAAGSSAAIRIAFVGREFTVLAVAAPPPYARPRC